MSRKIITAATVAITFLSLVAASEAFAGSRKSSSASRGSSSRSSASRSHSSRNLASRSHSSSRRHSSHGHSHSSKSSNFKRFVAGAIYSYAKSKGYGRCNPRPCSKCHSRPCRCHSRPRPRPCPPPVADPIPPKRPVPVFWYRVEIEYKPGYGFDVGQPRVLGTYRTVEAARRAILAFRAESEFNRGFAVRIRRVRMLRPLGIR